MPTLKAARYGIPLDASDEYVAQLGLEAIAERAGREHYVVTGPIEVLIDEPSVRIETSLEWAWKPVSQVGPTYGAPQARTLQWQAEVVSDPEAVPIEGKREDDGAVMFTVPRLIEHRGGSVRAMHHLGVEDVAVTAHRHNGEGIGILAAVPMDADEVQVEVNPGTGTLRVVKAPEVPVFDEAGTWRT